MRWSEYTARGRDEVTNGWASGVVLGGLELSEYYVEEVLTPTNLPSFPSGLQEFSTGRAHRYFWHCVGGKKCLDALD